MSSLILHRLRLILLIASAFVLPLVSSAISEHTYFYVVRPGDTASFILYKSSLVPIYNREGYLGKLKDLNPEIQDLDFIYPGQKLFFSQEIIQSALEKNIVGLTPEKEIYFIDQAPQPTQIETKQPVEAPPTPENTIQPEAVTPIVSKDQSISPERAIDSKSKKSLSAGIGLTYLDFAQNGSGAQNLSYSSVGFPSFSLQGEIEWDNGYGVAASIGFYPGELRAKNATLLNNMFYWETQSLELTDKLRLLESKDGQLRLRVGIQHHRLPYIQFPSLTTAEIRNHDVYNGTLGIDYRRKLNDKWYADGLFRYQALFAQSSSDDQIKFTNRFAFDGSIGLTRAFENQFTAAVYWYGQWLEFDYSGYNFAIDATDTGSNKFFFSDIELRVGYDF